MVNILHTSKTKWFLATVAVAFTVCPIICLPVSSPLWAQEAADDAFSSALEETVQMDEMGQMDNIAPEPAILPSTPPQPASETLVAPEFEHQVTAGDPSRAEPVPHSGQYYDSASIMPNAALGASIGPREVDPRYEPGSSFVVVSKSAGANSFPARLVAGQRALKLGRYSSALEIYEGLYRKSPKNRQVLMGLAVAQQNSGFEQSAIATYEELLKVDPNNVDAMVNMLGLIQKQYPAVAYRKLQELWDKNSQNPGIAAQLGLTSAQMGNAEDAIRYLGIASSLEPQNAMHLYNMAVVTDQVGAYKDALDLYEHALEVDATYGGSRSVPRERIYDRLAHLRRL